VAAGRLQLVSRCDTRTES